MWVAREEGGIKLRVRTRKKIDKEQGQRRGGRNWVSGRVGGVTCSGDSGEIEDGRSCVLW